MKKDSLLSPPTGGYFGSQAVELAGLISHPGHQTKGAGTSLVEEFIKIYSPREMIAYTRNPALLRVLGNVSMQPELLKHDDPETIATHIPHATVGNDGILYHIGRYAPDGLYGGGDPADKPYHGVILKNSYQELKDKNNALAVIVDIRGGEK
jgi:hypothetical protein